MSEPVAPLGAPVLAFTATVTGAVVRSPHLVGWAHAANVCALRMPAKRFQIDRAAPSSDPYVAGYTRSPGARYARIRWAMLADVGWQSLSVDLTITDGAGNSVASSSALIPNGFKADALVIAPPTGIPAADLRQRTGYLDLEALAATLVDPDWSFAFVVARPTGSSAIADRIEFTELPRDLVSSADDYGLVTADGDPGDPIYAGDETETGFVRLKHAEDAARLTQRAYLALAHWSATAASTTPNRSATSWGPLVAAAPASGYTYQSLDDGAGTPAGAIYQTRIRNIAATSAAGEACRVRFYYRVTGGGTADLRVKTGATGSPFVLSSLATAGSFAWSDWLSLAAKTNGTDQLDSYTPEAQTSDTSTRVYVASVQLDEDVP
mgnify:FL=1